MTFLPTSLTIMAKGINFEVKPLIASKSCKDLKHTKNVLAGYLLLYQ
jgi:hypothetical protein